MKRLLATTALISAIGIYGAYAQSMAITPPEGFTRDEMALTSEQLKGATVYDASGTSVGEISDLVLAAGSTTGADATATGDTSTGGAPATGASDGAGGDSTATTTTTDSSGAGTPATGESDGSGGDSTATTTTTDNTSGTGTAATGSSDASGGDMTATTTTGGAGSATTTATDGMAGAEVTHAVIDVGGFLGMGEHRVAIPVADLQVFKSDSELRIYLPWTKEQLEQQAAYDPADPATLGRSMMN